MKKALLFLTGAVLFCFLIFRADPKGVDVEYRQKVLKEPDVITVHMGSSTLEYGKDSQQYRLLFDTLNSTWFQMAHGKPETAPAEALYAAASPKELKTTDNRTYAENDDVFVFFQYTDGFLWYQEKGDPLTIHQITFLLPKKSNETQYISGSFTVAQTQAISPNEGLFVHYYPAEMVNHFWDWLLH